MAVADHHLTEVCLGRPHTRAVRRHVGCAWAPYIHVYIHIHTYDTCRLEPRVLTPSRTRPPSHHTTASRIETVASTSKSQENCRSFVSSFPHGWRTATRRDGFGGGCGGASQVPLSLRERRVLSTSSHGADPEVTRVRVSGLALEESMLYRRLTVQTKHATSKGKRRRSSACAPDAPDITTRCPHWSTCCSSAGDAETVTELASSASSCWADPNRTPRYPLIFRVAYATLSNRCSWGAKIATTGFFVSPSQTWNRCAAIWW